MLLRYAHAERIVNDGTDSGADRIGRRRPLTVAGAGLAATLAGCSGGSEGGTTTDAGTANGTETANETATEGETVPTAFRARSSMSTYYCEYQPRFDARVVVE